MKWSKYNYIYDSPKHGSLLFNHLSGAFLDISDSDTKEAILRLKEDPYKYQFTEDTKEIYDFLLSAGILCENDNDNRALINFQTLSTRFHPYMRSLTIMPTLDCNLACKYCFEESNRHSGIMPPKVIDRLKQHIKDQYGCKDECLHLGWFGGEPLIGFGIMEEITEYIKSLEIPFEASIITNGVLLNKSKINKLKSLQINNIQITLDGPKEIHDTKRIFKNGRGTYDIILQNLDTLYQYIEKEKGIRVDIRINVDRETKDQYHKQYRELKEKYPSFFVYPGIISQYGTCSASLPCFADAREVAEFYIAQYEKYGIIHPEFNITSKGMKSCMAECINTDLVGPNGELYLCLSDVGFKEGEIGSLFEGKNNMRLMSAYCSGYLTFNSDECRNCDVLTFCGGGCVNKRYRNKKYGDNHYICAAYKDRDVLEKYLDLHYEIKKKRDVKN